MKCDKCCADIVVVKTRSGKDFKADPAKKVFVSDKGDVLNGYGPKSWTWWLWPTPRRFAIASNSRLQFN